MGSHSRVDPEIDAANRDDEPDPDLLDVLAASLASGASAEEAGKVVSRSARTVRRWQAETDLNDRVSRHRRALIGQIAGNLAAAATTATEVIASKAIDPESTDQLRAALAVLDRALKFHAAGEVDVRVAELEARIAELEALG